MNKQNRDRRATPAYTTRQKLPLTGWFLYLPCVLASVSQSTEQWETTPFSSMESDDAFDSLLHNAFNSDRRIVLAVNPTPVSIYLRKGELIERINSGIDLGSGPSWELSYEMTNAPSNHLTQPHWRVTNVASGYAA